MTDGSRAPLRRGPGFVNRHLSDAEWGEIARRIVEAAGIAPQTRWLVSRLHQLGRQITLRAAEAA